MLEQNGLIADKPGLPAGEAPSRPSLVEQRTREIEAELRDKFGKPDSQQEFRLNEVAELLQASPATLLMAAHDLGLARSVPRKKARMYLADNASTYTQSQVLDLNAHSYVRLVYFGDISEKMGIRRQKIVEVAQDQDIRPVVPTNPSRGGKFQYHGYFDLDQAALIESANTIPDASENDRSVKKVVSVTGIPPARVEQILDKLGLEMELRLDPETGHPDFYLSVENVAEVIRHQQRSRRGAANRYANGDS